jgi:kynurenine formamidase
MLTLDKIVDLSLALNANTPIYPGDPKPQLSVATTLENQGYNLFKVVLGSQSGSHIDAPYHFNNHGATVDKIDLTQCFGTGLVIDVSTKKNNEQIRVDDIVPYAQAITRCKIVLFKTGWDSKRGTDNFFEHPYLCADGGEYLLERGIKTVAIDTLNLDKTGADTFPVHSMFACAGGIIAENLANFAEIDFDDPVISLLPLNLTGCDGSPVRALAMKLGFNSI